MSFINFSPFEPIFDNGKGSNSGSGSGSSSNRFPPSPVDENAYRINSIENDIESEISRKLPIQPVLRPSTENNPFSNVSIVSYDRPQVFSDYYRGPLAKMMEGKTEDNFTKKLYQNPGDKLFERENSQRQYYSVPVGSVPNNQESFAESLYGNKYVCKSGSIWMNTGVKYTDDSLVCGSGRSVPFLTNFGQISKE
jgi:hypothetical protein